MSDCTYCHGVRLVGLFSAPNAPQGKMATNQLGHVGRADAGASQRSACSKPWLKLGLPSKTQVTSPPPSRPTLDQRRERSKRRPSLGVPDIKVQRRPCSNPVQDPKSRPLRLGRGFFGPRWQVARLLAGKPTFER